MDGDRPRHPSGRPIRAPKKVDRRKWNIPDDEYQTPRLQKGKLKEAIGFVHSFPRDED